MSQHKKLTRRDFLSISSLALSSLALGSCTRTVVTPQVIVATREPEEIEPEGALLRLKEGNQRYISNLTMDPNQSDARRVEIAKAQHPFATILGCVDSRVPPEIIFDRGLGDLFVIRTAGQVLDQAVVGSIEFGVAELGIPLLVILGHEKCGAIKATIEVLEKKLTVEGTIGYLVAGLSEAVEEAEKKSGDLVNNAVLANVELLVAKFKGSPAFKEHIESGKLMVVGARYDLDTGIVEFLEETKE
jgi:carbonic anhydrase